MSATMQNYMFLLPILHLTTARPCCRMFCSRDRICLDFVGQMFHCESIWRTHCKPFVACVCNNVVQLAHLFKHCCVVLLLLLLLLLWLVGICNFVSFRDSTQMREGKGVGGHLALECARELVCCKHASNCDIYMSSAAPCNLATIIATHMAKWNSTRKTVCMFDVEVL